MFKIFEYLCSMIQACQSCRPNAVDTSEKVTKPSSKPAYPFVLLYDTNKGLTKSYDGAPGAPRDGPLFMEDVTGTINVTITSVVPVPHRIPIKDKQNTKEVLLNLSKVDTRSGTTSKKYEIWIM